jgi:prepilin-type N-terminal cleavage/methylation domain-containing protein
MKGGKNKQPLGYTLIEVMIVLAVSGVMFLIAASFISGKQQKAAFNSGVNEMASQIQDMIEQVSDGRYSDSPINCTYTPPPPAGGTLTFSVGGQQGTNSGCTFAGKFIAFGNYQPNLCNNSTTSNFAIFTLAGSAQNNSLAGVTPIATPIVSNCTLDLTNYGSVPQGLTVKDVQLVTNAFYVGHVLHITGHTINGFGFVIQSAGVANGAGEFSSGGQTIQMVDAPSLTSSPNPLAIQSGGLASAKSISVCLTDNTNYAEIILGGFDLSNGASQSELQANVHQLEGSTC